MDRAVYNIYPHDGLYDQFIHPAASIRSINLTLPTPFNQSHPQAAQAPLATYSTIAEPASIMPSAGGGAAAAGGGGDDPTTADEAATFSYNTRTGLNLVLHQSRRSFNCGTTLWSAGEVLARYLEQEKALFKNRGQMRVLELGAGLGLAGIVAALQVRRGTG